VVEKAMTTTFVLVDHSDGGAAQDGSHLTPAVLSSICIAVAKQLSREFAAEWGGSYSCRIGACVGDSVVKHDEGEVEVAVFQNEDVSGAAGYHDRDPQGRAYIHVALDDASSLTTGEFSLSVIISHECCETAADPSANRWADRAGGVEEALETCDRVEDAAYEIDGVSVSNFLLQSAFDPGSSAPWDHMNLLTSQDGQTTGGYVIERQQAALTSTTAYGLTIEVSRQVVAHTDISVTESFKRRKNHPASRTSRRGASIC
jgi:hypothetical protein